MKRDWFLTALTGALLAASVFFLTWTVNLPVLSRVLWSVGVGFGFAFGCLGCYYRGRASVWRELADEAEGQFRKRYGNGGFSRDDVFE